MSNREIRIRMFSEGLRQWEVAKQIGVDASTLSVWFRQELTDKRKEKVEAAIDSLIERKQGNQ